MHKIVFIFISFFTLNVQSQQVELFCKGVNTGTDVRNESLEFPMWVTFKPPDFGLVRRVLVPGCMDDGKK
jgi:hypothetical protein